jgi:ferric-dicitrate binding protein FerR (iron transport regulator)
VVTSGATLRTGSRSRAELEVAEFAARFVVSSKTRFLLAHDQPGVLLEIERGSVHAIFGELPQGDTRERLVTTPSAVLAVRGTEYGVDVAKDGDTSVTVFKGTVEVWERDGAGERIRVRAGQQTRVKKGRAPSKPQAHGLSSGDWDRGRRWSNPSMGGVQQSPDTGPRNQRGGAGSGSAQGGSKKHGG